jgi:N12 class adenine-specific DNA methylase
MTRLLNPLDVIRAEENSSDRDASILFRKMILQKDSELLISPISNRYFVKNDANNILLILEEYELVIINHVFGYNIKLSQKAYRQLYTAFVNEVEDRRKQMERTFSKNVKHSLQTLIQRLDD